MRQTIKEIEVNIAYRWFLGLDFYDKVPHFTTLSQNYRRRFKDSTLFEDIFENILMQAFEHGFVDESIQFVDATHVKAYANRHKHKKVKIKQATKDYQKELEEEIPYQDVPRIPGNTSEANKPSNNPPKKTPLVKGGNTKAVNNLATGENKARGSVIENVDRNGKDITPSGDTEKDKENPVDVRQFLTFQTKSGKTMHIIVDYSSNQDNVRLLTEVGEQDLLNMIESEDKNTIKVEEPKKEEVKKEEPKSVPVKEEKKSGIGSFLIVALVIGGVVGAGYYFKVVKAKEDKMLEDFEEDDEDYISESEDESDNEESHEESSEDEDDELL